MSGPVFEKVTFNAANGNGAKIAGRYYPSHAEEIKGAVQICHGMAEYIGRYEEFIAFLNRAGYHVCGIDMMGHGDTYELNKDLGYPKGYFGNGKTDAADTVRDIMEMHRLARVRFGEDIPYYLFGHSMGSFIVRNIYSLPEYACEFKKFVFSSTGGPNPAMGFGRFLSALLCLFGGAKKKGKLIGRLAFGTYQKRIENAASDFDWLSTDPMEVQIYLQDPMCGFDFTNEGYNVLFTIAGFVQSTRSYQNLPDAPCLFTYGSEDPVGNYGTGVEKIISAMRRYGARISARRYESFRHELQHEPVRDDYFRDVTDFLNQ
ncbi:MAG: alpha/beta hydrolase [Clostridiales bacterium]|nr:alpha/beta hydrolase [Clostridiales bacterium]